VGTLNLWEDRSLETPALSVTKPKSSDNGVNSRFQIPNSSNRFKLLSTITFSYILSNKFGNFEV
jgi:hypothetical protein